MWGVFERLTAHTEHYWGCNNLSGGDDTMLHCGEFCSATTLRGILSNTASNSSLRDLNKNILTDPEYYHCYFQLCWAPSSNSLLLCRGTGDATLRRCKPFKTQIVSVAGYYIPYRCDRFALQVTLLLILLPLPLLWVFMQFNSQIILTIMLYGLLPNRGTLIPS